MSYQKLGVIKFGKALLTTGDLDPMYIALWEAKLDQNRLKRWLLAYWYFYAGGVSSKLSYYEGKDFFRKALQLAKPESKTPRGTERRHFRGEACLDSIRYFHDKYDSPEQAIDHLLAKSHGNVLGVVSFVKERWPLFGPWIGFKIADMLERLDITHISFPIKTLEMYSEPTKGAELICKKKGWDWDRLRVSGTVLKLLETFSEYKAPPRYERPCNVQEVESICCKVKSHWNGHYPVGKDTREIREGLEGWGKLAKRLEKHLPK